MADRWVESVDLESWVLRWDRMQARYNARRDERFQVLLDVIEAALPSPAHVVDLGCGTGSLTLRILERFPAAQVTGIDVDPAMLTLAEARLAGFGTRVRLIQADLRRPRSLSEAAEAMDVVVSATALHWLAPDELQALYREIGARLALPGLFLNADHVSSPSPELQAFWEQQRRDGFQQATAEDADDWTGFWNGLDAAAGVELSAGHKTLLEESRCVEEGMPLTWHFECLREAGFDAVDCFWRYGGDAVYGGMRAAQS